MKRTASYFWLAQLLALFVALSPCRLVTSSSYGQESPYAEDLQFVRELRSRGYSDLAREYLDKLSKNAPAELKKELPLERALTEMEAANDEPDSSKRIALYAQARAQFEQFLKANPKHPRAAETQLDIARATTLQGKTQLNRARLEEDLTARIAAGDKARQTLVAAFNDLKKLPKEKPETQLAMALNLLDQSETYLNTGSDAATQESAKRIQEAREILDQIAQGESNSKITWQARAWLGRCEEMLDDPNKAITKYKTILEATGPAAQDGKRLALYFNMLARKKLKETPNKEPLDKYLIEQASSWLKRYPNYARTSEGFGVQYWLAVFYLNEAENTKLPPRAREGYAARARTYLSKVEHTENEFTDRAKRLKIAAMDKQGTFKKKIDTLRTFEDCYVRAQYEQMQIAEDVKKAKDDREKAEKARKIRVANILQALQSGLKKPAGKEFSIELKNARTLLTFYLLDDGKSKEAVETGESFARNDKEGSSQAASAAIYALVAYGQLLAKRERDAADTKGLQQEQSYKDEKARMLALAHFMEQRWPKERAGDLARHEIALHLLREDKNPEAIKELAAITPAYPSYIRTQLLLARAALQQAAPDKDKGDPQGYYKLALNALTHLPEPSATADAETNRDYIQGKLLLSLELAKTKKFVEVDKLLAALKPKLDSLKVNDDPNKDKEKRREFQNGFDQLSLWSAVSQADLEFKAAKYKQVAQRLDPLVDKFNADQLPQLKESVLAPSLVGLDLRANVQLNDLKRARTAIKSLQALQTDKGADNTTAILSQLVSLITQQVEELRKKGDEANLKKAQAGFAAILDEVAGDQQKKPTPKLAFLLARCYAGMGLHDKAANLLKPFAEKEDNMDVPLHHVIQLLLVQEYRQLKKIDQARELLDDILKGKDGKPGWGVRDINAQKTQVMLLEDEKKYVSAAKLCNKYVTQLVPRLNDNKMKEHYFEFYYHLVYCILKHGQLLEKDTDKAKAVHNAASRIVKLEKAQPGFGSEESKKRFDELLAKEAELRQEYNNLKGRK